MIFYNIFAILLLLKYLKANPTSQSYEDLDVTGHNYGSTETSYDHPIFVSTERPFISDDNKCNAIALGVG